MVWVSTYKWSIFFWCFHISHFMFLIDFSYSIHFWSILMITLLFITSFIPLSYRNKWFGRNFLTRKVWHNQRFVNWWTGNAIGFSHLQLNQWTLHHNPFEKGPHPMQPICHPQVLIIKSEINKWQNCNYYRKIVFQFLYIKNCLPIYALFIQWISLEVFSSFELRNLNFCFAFEDVD